MGKPVVYYKSKVYYGENSFFKLNFIMFSKDCSAATCNKGPC